MTNIVITGTTGVVGRRAVRELLAAGHRVSGVTRSLRGRRLLEGLGALPVEADVFDQASLTTAFAGADTVVNLLTHIPPADQMMAPGAWDENDRLRPRRVRGHRPRGAGRRRRAPGPGVPRVPLRRRRRRLARRGRAGRRRGTTAMALTAEANATERFAGDTVVLRFGLFIGPDSGLTQATIEAARGGISPNLGRREAYRPTVWLDDAGAAVAAAAVGAPAGIYNVADEDPPTSAEIDAALAAVVGRDHLRPAMDEVPPALEALARSQRVSSRRLRAATGWAPRVRARHRRLAPDHAGLRAA